MKHIYDDGGRVAAGYKGRADDCVCRAIAIVTGLPYQEIYNDLANGSLSNRMTKWTKESSCRKSARDGILTKRKWFKDFMKRLGFSWTPTMQIGSGCKVHLKADELPSGRLVVSLSRHYAAVIDGVLHDTYDCSRNETRCVYGYYQKISS